MILPEATLPLPRMGTRKLPGGLKECEWFDIASKILIPRWAAECIRDNLVLGQELREGESLKDRVAALLRTKGEQDKWERIVGWGRRPARALHLVSAEQWNGGWLELVELDRGKLIPYSIYLAFTKRNSEYLGFSYWVDWALDALPIVETGLANGCVLMGPDRNRAERLVDEATAPFHTYQISDQTPPHGFDFTRVGGGSTGVDEMCLCLSELLAPPEKRNLSGDAIRMIVEANLAYHQVAAARALDKMENEVKGQALSAQMASKVAKAQALADESKAEFFLAKGKAEAAIAAQKRAEEERKLAEEQKQEAEKRAEDLKGLLKDSCAREKWAKSVLDAVLGLKQQRDEALREPGKKAGQMYKWLSSLTKEEHDLYEWLMAGKSQNEWGLQRRENGLPGSKAYASGVRKKIEQKYSEAGLQGTLFTYCKGGRPPKVPMVAVGTAEEAELRGRIAERTRSPTRRKSPDD